MNTPLPGKFALLCLLLVKFAHSNTQSKEQSQHRRRQQDRKLKSPKDIKLALVSGGSSFFEPVQDGWASACAALGIPSCQYIIPNDTLKETLGIADPCLYEIQQLLDAGEVDGISFACGYKDHPEIFEQARAANIEMVVFDQPPPTPESDPFNNITHPSAFIGTDNAFLGRTMARLLRQLRPEGGTYGFIHRFFNPTQEERIAGFEEEIQRDNNRDDRPHWYRYGVNSTIPGSGTSALDRIINMATFEEEPPTAIIFLFQSPMRKANYTLTIDSLRHLNITYLGTDGADYQLSYLNRRYVDGLIGQLPFDMGAKSAETLWELIRDRHEAQEDTSENDSEVRAFSNDATIPLSEKFQFVPTNLVAYNLIPLELPTLEVDQNLLGNLVYAGYICFGVVALSCLACILWTLWYSNSMVVRAAQPFFLIMTAIGVFILSTTLIPLSFDDDGGIILDEDTNNTDVGGGRTRNDSFCMSIPWLAFIGFTVTFSALFSKTWRINRFFHSKQSNFGRIVITERDVLLPFLVLLVLNLVVLICWTLLDPLTYVRQFHDGTDFWNREISSYGQCQSENVIAYLIPLTLINLSVLVLACWQAFQARDIESEFSEATYIGLAVFSLCQAILTGIPIVVIVKDIPEAFYSVLTFLIFALCMAVLLLIFLPKFIMRYSYEQLTPKDQKRKMALSVRKSSLQAGGSSLAIAAAAGSSGQSGGVDSYEQPQPLQPPLKGTNPESLDNNALSGFLVPQRLQQPQGRAVATRFDGSLNNIVSSDSSSAKQTRTTDSSIMDRSEPFRQEEASEPFAAATTTTLTSSTSSNHQPNDSTTTTNTTPRQHEPTSSRTTAASSLSDPPIVLTMESSNSEVVSC